MNIFTVTGHLTRDVEIKDLGEGRLVGNTAIANSTKTRSGEKLCLWISCFTIEPQKLQQNI